MQALKALVIFLGVVIVAGIVVLAVTIGQRATKLAAGGSGDGNGAAATEVAADVPAAKAPAAKTKFGDREIDLPDGSEVIAMMAEGDRLMLRLRLANGRQRILVLDLATGKQLGSFRLRRPRPRFGP